MHDIVAHHMSVIAVRAETAPLRIPELPEAVKDDMAETSAIAREALTEMRRLLACSAAPTPAPNEAPSQAWTIWKGWSPLSGALG